MDTSELLVRLTRDLGVAADCDLQRPSCARTHRCCHQNPRWAKLVQREGHQNHMTGHICEPPFPGSGRMRTRLGRHQWSSVAPRPSGLRPFRAS